MKNRTKFELRHEKDEVEEKINEKKNNRQGAAERRQQ